MSNIKELSSGFDRTTYSFRGSTLNYGLDSYQYSDEEQIIQRLQALIDNRKITKRQAVALLAAHMEEKVMKQLGSGLVENNKRAPKRSILYCDYLLSELANA